MRAFRFIVVVLLSGCEVLVAPDRSKIDAGMQDATTTTDAGTQDVMVESGSDANASDAGADAGDAGAFDVGALAGLVLWLDAAKGVTKNQQDQVSKWDDQSGKGNHATQSTLANQPVLVGGVVNGLPIVRFDWTNARALKIPHASSLQFGTSFTLAVVARIAMNSGQDVYFYRKDPLSFDPTAKNLVASGLSASVGFLNAHKLISTQQPYDDSVARDYVFHSASSALELRTNGVQVATSGGGPDPATTDVGVGGFDGDIAEIVAVSGPISAQDLSALEAYLATKYKL